MVGGGRNNINRMQNDRAKGGINRKKRGEKIDRKHGERRMWCIKGRGSDRCYAKGEIVRWGEKIWEEEKRVN